MGIPNMPIPATFLSTGPAQAVPPVRLSGARGSSSPPRPPSADPIAELIARVTDALARRGLESSLAVGEAVAELLYDGDPAAWRLRSPKSVSLRGLVEEADLPMTPAALCRALGVYEVWATVAKGQPWSGLSASHYRAVLDLPVALQSSLLEQAWREQVSAERLREQAKELGPERRPRGGRLPTHPLARMVERIEREYSTYRRRSETRRIRDLEAVRAESLATRCESIADRLLTLARRLRQSASTGSADD